MNDNDYMRRAIALGEKGRVTAPPNPWVGCVVVKGGNIIGEGFHHSPGTPHAEVNALNGEAEGATAYVTLEPCFHFGRTPPCADALIQAKVARVVVGVEDPDPNVQGKGIQRLRDAGIEVSVGVEKEAVKESLLPYLCHRTSGKPYVVAKAAISVDGRIAAQDGSSQWISGPEARTDVHTLRSQSQAILVGEGTARVDSPQLTVRDVDPMPLKQPKRIILESGQNLQSLLSELGEEGVIQLLVEGGGKVLGSFLKERLIDKLVLYVGPRILGDQGIPLFRDLPIPTLEEAPVLKLINTQNFGDTVKLEYKYHNLQERSL